MLVGMASFLKKSHKFGIKLGSNNIGVTLVQLPHFIDEEGI